MNLNSMLSLFDINEIKYWFVSYLGKALLKYLITVALFHFFYKHFFLNFTMACIYS